jgi:hypothetical protein
VVANHPQHRATLGTPTPPLILEDQDTGDAEDDEVERARPGRRPRSPLPRRRGDVRPRRDQGYPGADQRRLALYINARNALRIDFANHLNLPVALLDGSPATASLTYATSEGKRSELDDLGLDYWTTPIQAALSQDNVVPRGTRIRFDFASRYAATNAPTGAPTQD